MTAPKKVAVIVKYPKINPSPIKNALQGTKMLNRSIFGRATLSRKEAHQPSIPRFLMAQICRKSEASNPPEIFCHPCVKNVYPKYNLNKRRRIEDMLLSLNHLTSNKYFLKG